MEHSKKERARRKNPMDPTVDGKRRATTIKRVHMARKRGERIQVMFDEKGQPERKHSDELMSWIGVLAREHVPIWIQDWRSRDLDGLKDIIWKETVTSFTVDESFRTTCLKSCGEAARNFRYDLYKTFVEEYVNEESVWTRPQKVIDNYPNIEEDDWFKKTGKWEKRDGLWLEQQTISDGELKDPACQKMEYNAQESQDTFESVGTNDVLSQALSRPEHKGRVRGQSKFVKPSQYFNLNRSSSKDNEVLSMRCQIEELKALMRGLCATKDVEPSVDPNNVPTVDQHNSFKASCSAQEKKHGVSDPPTMPVDSQERKLYIFDEVQGGQLLVAFGRAWLESLPTDTVHGIPLGEGNVRVSINVPKLKKSPLPIPTYDATTVEDAVNGFVAWPKRLVELDTSMNKASRGPSHVPDPAAGKKKKPKKGNQIEVPIPYTIMGFEMPVFLSFEYIYEFINLQEISANCILVYMRYLEELCRINGQAKKFVFVSPSLISPLRTDTEDAGRRERADNFLSFLRDAPKERLYLVPHNRGRHWVLGVIDPWEDLVLYFDPLREKKRDDFTELMNMALTDWKITTGEGIRRRRDCKTKISNRPCPLQEGSVECGYFILGFMRDIVLNGINALESKEFYSSEDLDLIRGEWASHVRPPVGNHQKPKKFSFTTAIARRLDIASCNVQHYTTVPYRTVVLLSCLFGTLELEHRTIWLAAPTTPLLRAMVSNLPDMLNARL
ncbi:hypothetical protein TIFTF001_037571 [Ficus carica]|uniref:Ubiquitin-like protease family profile domain-containing protein n=1 Tax=Ficus carica TaxID=3494 RepID=A0AA88E5U1_FICCA|nr:hypothetical protein TIFTF001_037571 [Ficus carica]